MLTTRVFEVSHNEGSYHTIQNEKENYDMLEQLTTIQSEDTSVKVDLLHLDPTHPDGGCCCGGHDGHHCCGRHYHVREEGAGETVE